MSSATVNSDSSLSGVHLGVKATTAGSTVTQTVFDTADPTSWVQLAQVALESVFWSQGYVSVMDVDQDGTSDYAWSLKFGQDMSVNNAGDLYSQTFKMPFGVSGTPFRSYGSLRVSIWRVSTPGNQSQLVDPDVPPTNFEFTIAVDLKDGAGQVVETENVHFGFDGTVATVPFLRSALDAYIGVDPATKRLAVIAREDHAYMAGTDASKPVPASDAGNPPARFTFGVDSVNGSLTTTTPLMGADLDWTPAPAQFAFGVLSDCNAPGGPGTRLGWDRVPYVVTAQPTQSDTPPDLHLSLTAGAGNGLSYSTPSGPVTLPTVEMQGLVRHVPQQALVELDRSQMRLTHHKRTPAVPDPSDPAPDVVLDKLVLGSADTDPATVDTPTVLRGAISALPPVTTADIGLDATGGLDSLDVRFCNGDWGSGDCSSSLVAAANARVEIGNVPGGLANTLPAPPPAGPAVSYASRDREHYPAGQPAPDSAEHTWRVVADAPGVSHVALKRKPYGGFVVDAEAAQAAQMGIGFDTDSRVTKSAAAGDTVTGSSISASGMLTPSPAQMSIAYTPDMWIPVDFSFDFHGTASVVRLNSLRYRGNTDNGFRSIDAVGQFGDQPDSTPTRAHIQYQPEGAVTAIGPSCSLLGVCTDPDAHIQYFADRPARLQLGMLTSNIADRNTALRQLHLWTDAVAGPDVGFDWGGAAATKMKVAPRGCALGSSFCMTPPQTEVLLGGTARIVYEPTCILKGAVGPKGTTCPYTSLWTPPGMLDRQYTTTYPAFTSHEHGIRYVSRDNNTWAIDAAVPAIRKVTASLGSKPLVCVEGPGDAKEFGIGVFVNTHDASAPPSPVYADAEIGSLPANIGVRLNPEAGAGDALLHFNAKSCDTTQLPSDTGYGQDDGPALRGLVKLGLLDTQKAMTNGSGAIALSRPVPGSTVGVAAHVLVDSQGPTHGTAVDAVIESTLPDIFVMFAPKVTSCPSSWLDALMCQSKPAMEVDDTMAASFGFRSSKWLLGVFDALVRVRSPLPETAPPDNECGSGICNMDITAHVDSLPGQMDGSFSLVRNRRIPGVHLQADLASKWGPPSGPGHFLKGVTVSVDDQASPACTGDRSDDGCHTKSGVPHLPKHTPNWRVAFGGVVEELHATLDFQGTEGGGVADNVAACSAYPHRFRGPLGIGYLHADVAMESARDVSVTARLDSLGRLRTRIRGDRKISGQVDAKLVNFAVSTDMTESLGFWGSVYLKACLDGDVPVRLTFNSPDTTLNLDKLHGYLGTGGIYDPYKATLQIGEEDPEWVGGVYWDYNHAEISTSGMLDVLLPLAQSWLGAANVPEAVNRQWDHKVVPADFLGVPFWNINPWTTKTLFSFYADGFSPGSISTGQALFKWPDPDMWPCCAWNSGNVEFMIDPMFNDEMRHAMASLAVFGSDPDVPDIDPGFSVFKMLYDLGSQSGGSAVVGDPKPVGTPSAGSFTWSAPASVPHAPSEIEAFASESSPIATSSDGTQYRLLLGVHWPRRTPDSSYTNGAPVDDVDTDAVKDCADEILDWDGVEGTSGPWGSDCVDVHPALSLEARYPNGEVRWREPLVDTAQVPRGDRPWLHGTQTAELLGCGFANACKIEGSASWLPGGHLDLTFSVSRKTDDGYKSVRYEPDTCGTTDASLSIYRYTFDPSGIGGQTRVDLGPTRFWNNTQAVITGDAMNPVTLTQPSYPKAPNWWDTCLDLTHRQTRKVWYFGDGTYEDVTGPTAGPDGTAGPPPPVTHQYGAVGTYPAMLVYFVHTPSPELQGSFSSDWTPVRWLPVDVQVASGIKPTGS